MTTRPTTLMGGLSNRSRPHSVKMSSKHDPLECKLLQDQLVKLIKEKKELEVRYEYILKENRRLVDKVAEIITEKQDLEDTIKRKNDLLKFKPRGKLSSFMSGMQDKLKNRPTFEAIRKTKIYENEPCFDTDLDKVIMHESHTNVPKVLVECIKKLESDPSNMQQLGLYRASGSHAVIQKIRYKVNANNYRFLLEQTDASNLTGTVKLFFRELKTPLLPLKYIEQIIPDEKEFLSKVVKLQILDVAKIFQILPPVNQSTIQFFFEHIARVAATPKNEMNVRSLSIVCGACVCFETMQNQRGGSPESFLVPNKCVEIMISHGQEVFF